LFGNPVTVYCVTLPNCAQYFLTLELLPVTSRLGLVLTIRKYFVAPGEAFHWNVTDVPGTLDPLAGEDSVGATGTPEVVVKVLSLP
jgi:hypothetical protein